MAKTTYIRVIETIDRMLLESTNPELDLKFMDPNDVLKECNLNEDSLPIVIDVILFNIRREHKIKYNYNHYTDLHCWDGDKMAGESNGRWKYLEMTGDSHGRDQIISYYNDYVPCSKYDFEIGDKYIPGDGSFALWLDAPTVKESKYFQSDGVERDAEFEVIDKPYWCLITNECLNVKTHAINMVNVRSLKTGRTYRFLNSEYNWSRFSSEWLDRKFDRDWEDDFIGGYDDLDF